MKHVVIKTASFGQLSHDVNDVTVAPMADAIRDHLFFHLH